MNLGSIQLPIQSATKSFAVLAKRGAGKTYTAVISTFGLSKKAQRHLIAAA